MKTKIVKEIKRRVSMEFQIQFGYLYKVDMKEKPMGF